MGPATMRDAQTATESNQKKEINNTNCSLINDQTQCSACLPCKEPQFVKRGLLKNKIVVDMGVC